MKKLTSIDLAVGISCLLLVCTASFAVVMATIMRNLFFAMYSDAKHPIITEIFLAADRWGFIIPLFVVIPSCICWSKGDLQKHGSLLMAISQLLTIAIMAIIVCGMLWPLLTTTWGLTEK